MRIPFLHLHKEKRIHVFIFISNLALYNHSNAVHVSCHLILVIYNCVLVKQSFTMTFEEDGT
jgi:hypothetical protein